LSCLKNLRTVVISIFDPVPLPGTHTVVAIIAFTGPGALKAAVFRSKITEFGANKKLDIMGNLLYFMSNFIPFQVI